MKYLIVSLILIIVFSCNETTQKTNQTQPIDSVIDEVNIDTIIDIDSEKDSINNAESIIDIEPIINVYESTHYLDDILLNPERYNSSIIGTYIYEKEEYGCGIIIKITKVGQKYHYHFINGRKKLDGEVLFFEHDNDNTEIYEKNRMYILFRNFWYQAYMDYPEVSEINILEVQGLIYNDTISIQNYGNTMNQYEKFPCGDKYIDLIKQ